MFVLTTIEPFRPPGGVFRTPVLGPALIVGFGDFTRMDAAGRSRAFWLTDKRLLASA
jgi:hypothetical protein